VATAPSPVMDLRRRAQALHAQQRLIEAEQTMAEARAIAPADPVVAFLHAQLRYELGHPAAALFAEASRLWPDNLDAVRNRALAEASEGDPALACSLLGGALRRHPQWVEGHRILASLEWVGGNTRDYDASFAAAAKASPQVPAIWLGWFAAVAQVRDWPRARRILAEAARHLGPTRALTEARLFVASESGDADEAARLLAETAGWDDPFVKLARIRQALRGGDPAKALAIALPLARQAPASLLAGQVWPYVATCWRLLGDDRAGWLDGNPALVRALDVGLTDAELTELAEKLRGLHRAQLPYPEQSVRGGTQTDRSVLLRHEPILQRARAALMAAVADYVAALPPHDPDHPFLSRPRETLRITGSWSVRLAGGGFNVAHSHPMGWISSAFYVVVPDPAELGPAPAGHFHFGAPPPELGLDLAPHATIAPQAGQIVLFPSILWHGTHPFARGERLNIAFDVTPAL